jgi:hypothetical protein
MLQIEKNQMIPGCYENVTGNTDMQKIKKTAGDSRLFMELIISFYSGSCPVLPVS